MARFMITLRSNAGGTFVPEVADTASYLVVPDGVMPLPSHALPKDAWITQIIRTFPTGASRSAPGNLLFVVHGFNVGITHVLEPHDDLAAGLAGKLKCTIVSFDWPSDGEVFAYLPDLDMAMQSAIGLVNAAIRPLIDAQKNDCNVAIHALCHSMGAFVARRALVHADWGTKTGSDWALNQLVFVAGDVAANRFVNSDQDTQSMLDHAYRLTNYFNKYDQALQISNVKRIGVDPRVGRVGLPPDAPTKTANVDCSDYYFTTVLNPADDPIKAAERSHGWYFKDQTFMTDLAQTLLGAADRTVVAGRKLQSDGTLTLV